MTASLRLLSNECDFYLEGHFWHPLQSEKRLSGALVRYAYNAPYEVRVKARGSMGNCDELVSAFNGFLIPSILHGEFEDGSKVTLKLDTNKWPFETSNVPCGEEGDCSYSFDVESVVCGEHVRRYSSDKVVKPVHGNAT